MKQHLDAPTSSQFSAYEAMFEYFNGALFDGKLPPVLLNFSRKVGVHGFFAPERWAHADGKGVRHEISINPTTLRTRPPIDIAATLVHEMVHHWQQCAGKPSRSGYHNAEWAAEMDRIGLAPSSTGRRGGKRVGQQVGHYIVAGGPFDRAFAQLPPACLLPLTCAPEPRKLKAKNAAKNKVKYSCESCGANVWGKPELKIHCLECNRSFEAAE